MYAPLGVRWGSELSLRTSEDLPEDLVGRPHQLMQVKGVRGSHQSRGSLEEQRTQSLTMFQEGRFKQQMGILEEDRGISSGGQVTHENSSTFQLWLRLSENKWPCHQRDDPRACLLWLL